MCIALYRVDIVGHIKNITSIAGCKHKTVTLKLTLTLSPNPDRYRRRCPDPNARIQKTEDVQIKTETTKLRLRKIWRCMFLIPPQQFFLLAFGICNKNLKVHQILKACTIDYKLSAEYLVDD